ncbi:hypothetical protein NQ318_020321 [Aromia moschata]|uniref:Uncharacterized protein n=1 Tax=Aromia moschata TaxID=1265417 RepID=A0AAV8XE13_9CUCU|nr:hypothetical protein NQ318_020321 [Aromia moschata]
MTLIGFIIPHIVISLNLVPVIVATILSLVDGENGKARLPDHLPFYAWTPFKIDTPASFSAVLAYQAVSGYLFSYIRCGTIFSFYNHMYRPNRSRLTRIHAERLLVVATYAQAVKTLGGQPMFLNDMSDRVSGTDAVFVSLMQFLAYHFDAIQGAFVTIRERSLKKIEGSTALAADGLNNSEYLNSALNSEMRRVCRNLQTIFKVCEDLEKAYKYVTLSQVLSTLLILCTCLYLVSQASFGSKDFYTEIVYLAAMGIQPFMYCWFGNEVSLKTQ